MNQKYLIVGAPGWLGTRFVRALCGEIDELSGYRSLNEMDEVCCLVHPDMNGNVLQEIHPRVKIFPGDITKPGSLKEFFNNCEGAILFHLAGIIHPSRGIGQIFQVNVTGTHNVLEAAVCSKVKRIIAVSSNSPAGTNPRRDHVFNKALPYNPYLAYGRSKMQMEILINNAFQKRAIETVILRPCWFYGPDQPPRQTLFFSMVKDGKFPVLGDGSNRRSMSYVDNTCQALLLSSTKQAASGQTYWIADQTPYTMSEIVDTVERLLEREFHIEVQHKRLKLPSFVGSVAYGIDYMLQMCGIYHQKIHVLSEMNKTIACSIIKAEHELGYHPKIKLEEGMRRSIQWCLDNGHQI